jgi:hypothetical protein
MSEVLNMARINKELQIDIRANFATRMRSLGKTPKDIEQLNLFLDLSLSDVNDIAWYDE